MSFFQRRTSAGRNLRRPVLYLSLFFLVAFLGLSAAQAATIRVHYDTGWGNNIEIRGDAASLSWSSGQAATWTSGNVWVYTTSVGDGGFEFKPLINDAVWSKGANYVVPSGDAVVDVYPFFSSSSGTIDYYSSFSSTILGNSRRVFVYLPPSYSENPQKSYPVLYLQDGDNLFYASTSFGGVEWQVDETLDSMIPAGQAREAVVVGVGNTGARMSEYTPVWDSTYGGGGGDAYLDFLEDELMPWLNSNYRTLTGPSNTSIGGSSLGGLISFYAAWTRSDVYGAAICMSSSFFWVNEWMINTVASHVGPKPAAAFYLDSGSDNAAVTFDMRDALVGKGYAFGVDLHHWYEPSHGHNEAAWRDRFPIPMDRLFAWQ